jgi:DNA-binding beta-propeller fold protein YncE
MVGDLRVPGRTRWTVFDPETDQFYVNIAEPAEVTIVKTKERASIVGRYAIPAVGPHGLDIDHEGRQLFCACDDGSLFRVDLESGKVSRIGNLAGAPDVIFFNPRLDHLYVAIGSPGVIQVFDTEQLKEAQRVSTEPGTHTLAFNAATSKVYALFPESHRASIYADS